MLAERVRIHIHASRLFDLMSPLELQELLSAMNNSPATTEATDSGNPGGKTGPPYSAANRALIQRAEEGDIDVGVTNFDGIAETIPMLWCVNHYLGLDRNPKRSEWKAEGEAISAKIKRAREPWTKSEHPPDSVTHTSIR